MRTAGYFGTTTVTDDRDEPPVASVAITVIV
jgi:hypothetical protein